MSNNTSKTGVRKPDRLYLYNEATFGIFIPLRHLPVDFPILTMACNPVQHKLEYFTYLVCHRSISIIFG
jgi:hypothetical protein